MTAILPLKEVNVDRLHRGEDGYRRAPSLIQIRVEGFQHPHPPTIGTNPDRYEEYAPFSAAGRLVAANIPQSK
jgi:hypothetical protein